MTDLKPENFRFHGVPHRYAVCNYDSMERHLASYSNYIATTAQTLENSSYTQDAYFWTSTKNIFTPEGVIVFDDPFKSMPSDPKELMKMYESGNSAVRFAKKGFNEGKMSVDEFIENPLVLAQIGKNKEFLKFVANKARAYSIGAQSNPDPDKACILGFMGYAHKNPVRNSAIEIHGAYGQYLHISCDIGENTEGSVHGFLKEIKPSN